MLSAFLTRPLATSQDDRVSLQDCLEVGRMAKVKAFRLFLTNSSFLTLYLMFVKGVGVDISLPLGVWQWNHCVNLFSLTAKTGYMHRYFAPAL